jgi:hypothetical protein
MLSVLSLCIIASSRIPQNNFGRWTPAFSGRFCHTFSSRTASASSLCVSSSSRARSHSYNTPAITATGATSARLGGGRGQRKANTKKSIMHQETSSSTVRNSRGPTFLQHAPSGWPQSSPSSGVVATRYHDWNPCGRDASHGHHHEPSP